MLERGEDAIYPVAQYAAVDMHANRKAGIVGLSLCRWSHNNCSKRKDWEKQFTHENLESRKHIGKIDCRVTRV